MKRYKIDHKAGGILLSHRLIPSLVLSGFLVMTLSTGAFALDQEADQAHSVQDSTPSNSAELVNEVADEQQARFAQAIAAGTVLEQMSMEQVLQIRGEPNQKEVIPPDAELWRYAEGEVAFSVGKVTYVSLTPNVRAPAPRPLQADTRPSTVAPARTTAPNEQPWQVDAPPIAVGDTYVYESRPLDEDGSSPGSHLVTRRTVTDTGRFVTLSSLVLQTQGAKPRMLYYDRQWNLVQSRNTSGSGRDYSPALRYYDFPLYPGKTWRETTTETDTKTGAIRQHTLSGRVEGWETVSVPAGTFHGIKVELKTELYDPNSGEHIIGSDTSWYVPEVRRSVKSVMTGKAGKQRLIHLLSYHLNGQTSVYAEEAYICATVSEILETESEDCMYFIAKGDFEPDGKQGRELSICLDNDNDVQQDASLAIDSYEQQKEVYILVDEDSVRRIESSCLGSAEQETASYFSPCVENKIADFRSEMGEEAILRMDVISEWEAECSSPK
ncbi:MAG: hypothetical protein C1943_09355 [Halochromatium sp.]|nr:hypothetical protein [Halochromatium sp.]